MASINHIQLTWTDLSNITRCHMVTKKRFESSSKDQGNSISQCILSVPFLGDVTSESPVGVIRLVPDVNRPPKLLPWFQEVGICFGSFYKDKTPFSYCPRQFLARQEKKLNEAGLKLGVGFELEFYLLKQDGTSVDTTVFAETKSFHGKTWTVISEIIKAMELLGISIWQYHAESGPGQFEICIGPFTDSMVEAADGLVLARQTIYNIAAQYDMKATFLPKPFVGIIGSATHTHMSLVDYQNKNLLQESVEGEYFTAGILKHLPSMMLILAPTPNSYDRIQPHTWSGAFQCVGSENKEAPIRLVKNGNIWERIEIKTPDGTSNPYLMLGTLIGAGIDGITQSYSLPPEINVAPTSLPKETQPPRLPSTLAEAIHAFKNSKFVSELFGKELKDLILSIRQAELDYWTLTDDSTEKKLELLLKRY